MIDLELIERAYIVGLSIDSINEPALGLTPLEIAREYRNLAHKLILEGSRTPVFKGYSRTFKQALEVIAKGCF